MSGTEDATGVIATWFIESGEEVTPTTLVAEVAMDKLDAEFYPEISGVIALLVAEKTEIRRGAAVAQVN